MMNQSILDVAQLSVVLGQKEVLSGVDMSVPQGSIVCIVGPNGAGKSTLLKCLNRIHQHYAGDIFLEGRSTRSLSQKMLARKISYVPQVGGDPPPFTVRELMRLSRYPYQQVWHAMTGEDKKLIEKILMHTGLEAMGDRFMSTLSGGERQKAFIAASLAQETDILLLDEPTSFLDYQHQNDVTVMVHEISRLQGRTVLSVTHDINWALQMADYILALKSGRSVWFGPSREFLNLELLSHVFNTTFRLVADLECGIPLLIVRGRS